MELFLLNSDLLKSLIFNNGKRSYSSIGFYVY